MTNENPKMDKKLYSFDDIKNDPDAEVMDMKPAAIPNIENITARVVEMLDFMNTPDMSEMEISDNVKFYQIITSKFEDLPFSIIKLLLEKENRGENIGKLLEMFDILQNVKYGNRNIEDAYNNYKENLNEQFIYPKFGGKTEFERKMAKKARKHMKKQNK